MRRILLTLGLAALTGVLVAGATPVVAAPSASVPDRYLQQKITWQPCFAELPPNSPPGADRLQCGFLTAPRDWNRSDEKKDITVAVSRLQPEKGPAGRLLFTNPGGPGGPGRTLPLLFPMFGKQRVQDAFDIIGIDPRGTGGSTNVTCGAGVSNLLGSDLEVRDRSRGNIDLQLDSAGLLRQYCQTRSAEFGRLVSTDQTVKDLDLLRAVLGKDKISWVGYSGGTWMGAYYATYFPNRVDKFVLDSNTDFTGTFQKTFMAQPQAFERRFREDFLPWVAKYDAKFHFGTTGEQTRQNYEKLRQRLVDKPLVLGENLTVTSGLLDAVIISSLYSKTSFVNLGEVLDLLNQLTGKPTDRAVTAQDRDQLGQAAGLIDRIQPEPRGLQPIATDAFVATFLAITCNDTPWQGEEEAVRASDRLGPQYPLSGWGKVANPCHTWKRPNITLTKPTGQGVPSVLMVQSDHDPATNASLAEDAHRNFAGSRLLRVHHEGDHGIYVGPNKCVDDIVDAYLLDNAVPDRDLDCEGVPLPDPTQESGTTNPLVALRRLTTAVGPLPRS
ncbi:alpha/beta fold hydrolase [Pseudonocardiaceae bacterium YIM PH 21723]|nr:alpha/beta fold hydrolase [Pseudonocardiaceae bacterium YIM PH 21723]